MKKAKKNKFRIALTVVALVEAIAIAAVATFAWMEGGNRGKVEGSELQITSGSDLIMLHNDSICTEIEIPSCNLEEVSSPDGRNFFFPLGDNNTNQTYSMKFREGVEADVNKRYISVDFDLMTVESGASVFLSANTGISTSSEELGKALRMAILTNDEETPVVFSPTQFPGYYGDGVSEEDKVRFSPIAAINRTTGVPTGMTSVATAAYGDFGYRGMDEDDELLGKPLFRLRAGERKHLTLVVWLEGTEFNTRNVANKNISINVGFTTNMDDLKKINFVDNTHDESGCLPLYWTKNTQEYNGVAHKTMMYIYANGSYYAMFRPDENDTEHWSAYIPNSITEFKFRRYSPDAGQWWNEWDPFFSDDGYARYGTDENGDYTYVAICGNGQANTGTKLWGAYGYWRVKTMRIYFQDESNSYSDTNAYCAAYKSSAESSHVANYKMSRIGERNGYRFFYVDINATQQITNVKFFSYGSNLDSKMYSSPSAGKAYWYRNSSTGGDFTYDNSARDQIVYRIYFQDSYNSTGNSGNSYANVVHAATYTDSNCSNHKKNVRMVYSHKRNDSGVEKYFYYGDFYESDGINSVKFYSDKSNRGEPQFNTFAPFNGAAYWYDYSSNNKGAFIYREATNSMIYPKAVYNPSQTDYD
ncbi:MAG: hypothetical protein IIZ36_02790 [Ruminococcus sp.]|nr:hypothetical protein [Ruminococcus sp.]